MNFNYQSGLNLQELLSDSIGLKAPETKFDFTKVSGRSVIVQSAAPPEPAKTKAQELFQGQRNPKKLKASKPVRLEQWIEIRQQYGFVTVQRFPNNLGVIEQGQKMWPPPNMVYRRLNFPDGIPRAYDWTGVADENHRKTGGCGIQRMSIDTWLEVIELEAKYDDGRVIAVPNLPRHLANGECQCANCQRGYKVLERFRSEGKDIEQYIQSQLKAAA